MFRIALPLAVLLLLPACSDGSGTFALPDGCYYSTENRAPVLKIEGHRGLVLTPGSTVREVRVSPRVDSRGAYLAVSPGFLLRGSFLIAEANGQQTGDFRIESREGGSQAILVPADGAGYDELRLGPYCGGPVPPVSQSGGMNSNSTR